MDDPKIQYLIEQIQNRRSGSMTYSGLNRLYSPHMLGITNKGQLVVHAFQYGGDSSDGAVDPSAGSWKFFYLNKIEALFPLGPMEPWFPADLVKSETPYTAPKFIAKVLALAPRGP